MEPSATSPQSDTTPSTLITLLRLVTMSIFLDFDGTITVQDTIGELANFALGVRATQGDDLKEEWDAVVKAYLDEYNKHVDEYHFQESVRQEPAEEIKFLRTMKTVELKSLSRINSCQLFRGISRDTFREAGRDAFRLGVIKIRPGFKQFVEERIKEGWKMWIISVNWSAAFIEGVCDTPGISVIANDVRDDGCVVGPELLGLQNLTNSSDKLDAMNSILQREGLQSEPSVYFGDSVNDLECLLAATSGVVMSDKADSNLLETLKRIGKQVPRSADLDGRHSLCWAPAYDEVMENLKSLKVDGH